MRRRPKKLRKVPHRVIYEIPEEENLTCMEREARERKKRNAPLFITSLCLHIILLIAIFLIPSNKKEEDPQIVIITDYVEIENDSFPRELVFTELKMPDIVVDTRVEDSDQNDEENEIQDWLEDIKEDIIENDIVNNDFMESDALALDALPSVLGIASPEAKGSMPAGYLNRTGKNKKKALEKFGGDINTNEAVENALRWLAVHQEPDGSWDVSKYQGKRNNDHMRFSATACALLPFLGAGYSENVGRFKKTVRGGIRVLNQMIGDKMKDESDTGALRYGRNYGTAIGLMALSEATLFGSSVMTRNNANRLADLFISDFLTANEGGWKYTGGGQDFSVSGWVALGLKSAKSAELNTMMSPESKTVISGYRNWVDKEMTNPKTGMAIYRPGRSESLSMTWVGMFQKQFLGYPRKDDFLLKAAANSLDRGWVEHAMSGNRISDIYIIYYGTLAAFQQQGKFWDQWNLTMKPWMTQIQRKGNVRHFGGSWDPSGDRVGSEGGRVMTTALMALCLEVYYRYDIMN